MSKRCFVDYINIEATFACLRNKLTCCAVLSSKQIIAPNMFFPAVFLFKMTNRAFKPMDHIVMFILPIMPKSRYRTLF